MTQATMLDGPSRRPDYHANLVLDRPQIGGRDLGSVLLPFLRPRAGEGIMDEVRWRLSEDDLPDDELDDPEPARPAAPQAGLAAGLALCIPTLVVIGLLYTLLK